MKSGTKRISVPVAYQGFEVLSSKIKERTRKRSLFCQPAAGNEERPP